VAVYEATGDVYTADTGFNRIQQFDEDGEFIRAWGFDVNAPAESTPESASFETCTVKAQCISGVDVVSPAPGGELSNPSDVAVDQTNGNVYVTNQGMARIEVFTSSGAFVRAFGLSVAASGSDQADEEQRLTVDATAGQYKLTFGADTTTDIAWNEAAAGVAAKLNALASINGGGGNVTVEGGPGGSGGATPYLVKFGGALADLDQSEITVAAGTVALTGTAEVATFAEGGSGYEICEVAGGCQAGTPGETGGAFAFGGSVAASLSIVPDGGSAPNPGNVLLADPNSNRIQEFSPAGAFIRTFGWDVVASGPDNKNFAAGPDRADEVQKVVVRATGGNFRLGYGEGGLGVSETDELKHDATDAEVEAALNKLTNIDEGGGSVSVDGGPGDGPGSNPYVITFDGGPWAGTGHEVDLVGIDVSLTGGTPATAIFSFVGSRGGQGFEVCRKAALDICQAGNLEGFGSGLFGISSVTGVVEDSSGNIYTLESQRGSASPALPPQAAVSGLRVQKFTQSGNGLTPEGTFDCADLCGTAFGSDSPIDLAVDGQGFLYVVKNFPTGTGNPPAELVVTGQNQQSRILKIDPSANGGLGGVVETLLVNTGQEPGIEGDLATPIIDGVTGLAVPAAGKPIYLATSQVLTDFGRSRIYRLNAISAPSGSVATTAVGATTATLDATIKPAGTLGPVKTLYRFEYRREGTTAWISGSALDVSVGNGSAGGESSNCSSQLQAAICHVSGELDGLEVGRTYQYRLRARTSYQGAVFTTAPEEFTTEAAPPSVATGSAVWGGPPSTNPSLTFSGSVNPQGGSTTYAFEYVSQADYEASQFAKAQSVPAAPIAAGHGAKTLAVVVAKNGLDAGSEYKFRLVASNLAGTTTGNVRSVAASQDGDRFLELVSAGDSQGANVSSDVTVSDDGERVAFTALTFGDDQQAAPWITNPAIAQRGESGWTAKSVAGSPLKHSDLGLDVLGSVGNAEVSQRLWATGPVPQSVQLVVRKLDGTLAPISPLLSPLDRTGNFDLRFRGGSNDLSTLVLSNGANASSTLFPGEPLPTIGSTNLYAVSGAGTASPSVSLLNRADGGGVIGGACGAALGADGSGSPRTNAVSANGSIAYFTASPVAPSGGSCAGGGSVGFFFEGDTVLFITSGSFVVGQVISGNNIAPGTVVEAVDLGAGTITISAPTVGFGSFFEPNLLTASFPKRIFKRVGDASAVEVSACAKTSPGTCPGGSDLYWGASADGSKALFTTSRQLTDSDTDSTDDLYVYDESLPASERLIQASAGEVVAGDHPTIGSGAEVQGVADFAMDGSRVYFVAKGRLTSAATAGANNLYVFERDAAHPVGRIDFVATLAPGTYAPGNQSDPRLWAKSSSSLNDFKPAYALPRYEGEGSGRVDGDGHLFLFVSQQQLLPTEDQDAVNDLYRYDDETGELECLSCAGDGAEPVSIIGRDFGWVKPDQVQRERVASEDGSQVVFRTREQLLPGVDTNTREDVYLWDDGALSLISAATAGAGASYPGGGGPSISPDGRTVFFATSATLLPQDLDNGAIDIYGARVDGGFLQGETVPSCAAEGTCRTVVPPPPPTPQGPGTATITGSGNVKAKKCKKNKVLRGGKCVKLKQKKHKKHKSGKGKSKSRDGSGRRAGR
jgi:hypothetical protein